MGSLTYDGWMIEFEDRLLTHLHVVVVQRFRNNQSFAMSWLDALEIGDGRSSIWLHPLGHYYFKFSGSRAAAINPEWLQLLTDSAQSSHGLVLRTEDGKLARSTGLRRVGTGH
jgi:hypothetical protein